MYDPQRPTWPYIHKCEIVPGTQLQLIHLYENPNAQETLQMRGHRGSVRARGTGSQLKDRCF